MTVIAMAPRLIDPEFEARLGAGRSNGFPANTACTFQVAPRRRQGRESERDGIAIPRAVHERIAGPGMSG